MVLNKLKPGKIYPVPPKQTMPPDIWPDLNRLLPTGGLLPFLKKYDSLWDILSEQPMQFRRKVEGAAHQPSAVSKPAVSETLRPPPGLPLASEPDKPVKEFTVQDVVNAFHAMGLASVAGHVEENAVDGPLLLALSQEEMVEHLHMKPLQAKKVALFMGS